MGPKSVAADLIDFDHAAIARSLGCDGVRVTSADELKSALVAAVAAKDRPFIIDVPTSMATSFLDVDVRRFLTPDGERSKTPESGEGGVL
jgi:acetolactate synthase-1/2/3 large subunit